MTALAQYQPHGSSASELIADIEAAVRDGRLLPGSALPSVRELARSLDVSPGTVSSALAQLRRRGTILTEPRRGTRISSRPPFVGALRPTAPPGTRDLATGNPDFSLLPRVRRIPHPRRGYGDSAVLPQLEEIALRRLVAEGVDTSGGVIVASGALDGVDRALAAHLSPGDKVAIEDPGYADLIELVRSLGLVPLPMEIDASGPLPDALSFALQEGARAVVITPRAQNPFGATLSSERANALQHILGSARKTLVVLDDHLGPVAGASLRPVRSAEGPWALIHSVAKSLGPDIRVAIMTGDKDTLDRVAWRQSLGPGWVSHILQGLAASLLDAPATERCFENARTSYDERRLGLIAALEQEGITGTGASGLNVWIPCTSETHVVAGLLAHGWAVAPGERYRIRSGPAIRVTTSRLTDADARAFATDLARVLMTRQSTRNG